MKMLYIWDSDYPWDVRVEKICKSLAKHGNEVHVAARNLKMLPLLEELDGLHIHRLRAWKNKRINYALSFPLFFSPMWTHLLDGIISKYKIELIFVRDLPLALAGIWAGKRHKIPVIFDMAEDYVSLLRGIWRRRRYEGINLIIRNPYFAELVERYSLKKFHHILVVVDEAKNMLIKRGAIQDRVTVVGNTPPLESLTRNTLHMNHHLSLMQERYSAIYTGGIQLGRGIQTVLASVPDIIKEIPDFLFVVVGDGYATAQLKALVREKRIGDHVLWVGWLNHQRMLDYISVSKLGLVPHAVNDHKNTTVPNKLFDYMGFGIPVISSDAAPMKRILESENCGITFKSGDHRDLARAILEVYTSRFDYGKNALEAVRKKYNWKEDEKRLLRVMKTVHS